MRVLWFLFGLLAALVLAVFVVESFWGGGHPSLSGVLLVWGLYSTLTLYLARALLGVEFPSPDLMIVGFLEYPLVGVGLASLVARLRGKVAGSRTAIVVFLIYIGAQVAAHVLLNLQSVNVRLMADTNPGVSIAAVNRIRESGDTAAVPVLQQKLIEDFERDGHLESSMIDALTVLGGAKGWQDLLERPDLCRKYFAFVPIGLRDTRMQVPVDVVRMLALMKAGPSSNGQYDYQERVTNDEMSRFDKDRPAVAEEWIVWAKSNTPCR